MENPCCECEGTGTIRCEVCGGAGRLVESSLFEDACPKCRETGKTLCPECRGSGVSPFLVTDRPLHHLAISI